MSTPPDSSGSSHRLVVMRHAKAEPFAETDHARPLTDRGRREAAEVGQRLAELGVVPEHAVVSTAVRAVQTWEAVSEGLAVALDAAYDEAVYRGDPDVLLECLRTVPGEVRTVVMVGHNPTVAHLVHLVSDGEGDPHAVTEMLRGFPPGAAAVIEVSERWGDLAGASGRLVALHTPA